MDKLTCPVLEAFLALVTETPTTTINRDVHQDLLEVGRLALKEEIDLEVVRRRALRAYELSFTAVLSVDLLQLNTTYEVRASEGTFDWFLRTLHANVDEAVVDNMEYALGDQANSRGPSQMRRVTLKRMHRAGVRLIDETPLLREALLTHPVRGPQTHASRLALGKMGIVLADVSNVMVVGLSRQLGYAHELLHS